jgi:hypothetical protein
MTNLILHIGAHRTGTTTLQASLDAAQDVLSARGIAVLTPPRPDKRNQKTIRKLVNLAGSVRRPMGKLLIWFKRKQAQTIMLDLLNTATLRDIVFEDIILSDEKILGSIFGRNGKSIYPATKSHLQALKKLLPLDVSKIHLTLRSYDTFIISSYVMRAVYGSKIKPFETMTDELLTISKGWNDVIDDIRFIFPNAELTVSLFEVNSFEERLRSLVNDPQNQMNIGQYIVRPMNRAPTREAIEHVLGLSEKPDNPDEIVDQFAEGTPFDPLTKEQKTALQERYKKDTATIQNRSDIRFLKTTE